MLTLNRFVLHTLPENFESLYWLNTGFLSDQQENANKLTPIFFPGIVASGAGGNYAAEVIGLFAREAAAVGINARVYFENTNLSEMYIPRIVHDAIATEPRITVNQPRKIDQTMYRLVSIGSTSTD